MFLVCWSCPWWGQSWEQGGAARAGETETGGGQTSREGEKREIQEAGGGEGTGNKMDFLNSQSHSHNYKAMGYWSLMV